MFYILTYGSPTEEVKEEEEEEEEEILFFNFKTIYMKYEIIINFKTHTLSIHILLYTVKILQFVRLLLKVNYMNRSLKFVIGVHVYHITLLYFTSVSPNRVAISKGSLYIN
jgi:hypothetical protein